MNRDLNKLNNLVYGNDVFVSSGGNTQGIESATSDNNMTAVQNYIGGNDTTTQSMPVPVREPETESPDGLSEMLNDGTPQKQSIQQQSNILDDASNMLNNGVNAVVNTANDLYVGAKGLFGLKGGADMDQIVDYLLETETETSMRQMGGHYDPELQARLQRFFS